jgi:hypothetical protein
MKMLALGWPGWPGWTVCVKIMCAARERHNRVGKYLSATPHPALAAPPVCQPRSQVSDFSDVPNLL